MEHGPNAEQAEYWNGSEGRYWAEHEGRFDAMLAPLLAPIVDAAAIAAGDRVLDVGCGNGALSLAAAARGAVVTGIDLSGPMLARARERAAAHGVEVQLVQADAQVHALDPVFDALVSRFGVMFFSDPVDAFANLHRALRSGARLAFACWQDALANEWIAVPAATIVPIVGPPDMPPPGAPGPFAFADRDHVAGILGEAGFSSVDIDEWRGPLLLGGGVDVGGAVAWLSEGGMGKRFLGDADEPTRARALSVLGEVLAPFETDAGVRMDSAVWIVRARA